MSASEKLKRLEATGAFVAGTAEVTGCAADATGILPALIAVVEAAEAWPKPGEDGWIHVHHALTALDNALGKEAT